MSPIPVPVQLPTGTTRLPPLGGRLFALYRLSWGLLLAASLGAISISWGDRTTPPEIFALRLAKDCVLLAVSAILFRRRGRDPVASMLSLAFLLWIISSSMGIGSSALLPALIDRVRFLAFALALLFFPDGRFLPRCSVPIVVLITATFLLGVVEAAGLVGTSLYLPVAISCVLAALAVLLARYRALEAGTEKQQLKWVTLGLFAGIALILTARAGAALSAGMAMPMVGTVLIEALFQLGIIVLALGFLVSLLRYRLYDAEAAISRSAVYAALTLSLVGTFAACEALIELLGERYFGSSIGSVSGAAAAAVAAILLTPLHSRISDWAEQYFQRDLAVLKSELPDLLESLSSGASVKRLAGAALPRIEQAVQSTRIALLLDGRLVGAQGIEMASARRLLSGWRQPDTMARVDRDDDDPFPLRIALRCPFGTLRGWLLLGPRPDGSFYGSDDVEALCSIAPNLQRALLESATHEAEARRRRSELRAISRAMTSLEMRLAELETSGRSGCPVRVG